MGVEGLVNLKRIVCVFVYSLHVLVFILCYNQIKF